MLHGHLQRLCEHCSILRVGPQHTGVFGDPYDWAITVQHIEDASVNLYATLAAPEPSRWRWAGEVLAASGVLIANFARRLDDGTMELHPIDLQRFISELGLSQTHKRGQFQAPPGRG